MVYYPPDTPRAQGPLIVSTLFGVLAFLSFLARMYSLRLRKEGPRLEEWLLVGALCLTYVSLGIQWACVTLGGTGRHLAEVEPSAAVLTLQLIIPFEALYGVTLMLVKFSMLRFYARIFSMNHAFQWCIRAAAMVIFLWMISVVLETFLLCRPLAYNWDTSIEGTCGNRLAVYVGAGVTNMITDFIVLLLPIPFVWKLKMPTASKIGLIGIFGLGIFITAISIVRIKSLTEISFTDPTWTLPMGLLWTVLEPELAIINANLPLMRRLFAQIAPRLFSFTRSRVGKRTGTSHPSKFERINDDGVFLKTIGGGFVERKTACQGGSGSGSTTSWAGSKNRGGGGGGGGGGETMSTTGIVRQTAFHMEVESLSDADVDEETSRELAAAHRTGGRAM